MNINSGFESTSLALAKQRDAGVQRGLPSPGELHLLGSVMQIDLGEKRVRRPDRMRVPWVQSLPQLLLLLLVLVLSAQMVSC